MINTCYFSCYLYYVSSVELHQLPNNYQVKHPVLAVKEEPAHTIKIEEEFFCDENKYISSEVGFFPEIHRNIFNWFSM